MFYSLKGTLTYIEPGITVIECGGVGFKCLTSMQTQKKLPKIGETVTLYTHMNVREDALDLFGFTTLSEQSCFKLLIGISGVGPKAALAILSELSPDELALALASGNTKAITKAQGVGPKLAQRIIVELKDKVLPTTSGSSDSFLPMETSGGAISFSNNVKEAINALTVLGYQQQDAAKVVASLDCTLSVEELIRQALKKFSGRL